MNVNDDLNGLIVLPHHERIVQVCGYLDFEIVFEYLEIGWVSR